FGIEEAKPRERVVEIREHLRSTSGFEGSPRALLALGELAQLSSGGSDLLVRRRRVAVEIDARAVASAGPRTMIGRRRPDIDDEAEEAPRLIAQGPRRIEDEGRERLGEEAERALDMRFVLRPLGRRADADRVADRLVDVGGVVRRPVVEEERERRRAGCGDA